MKISRYIFYAIAIMLIIAIGLMSYPYIRWQLQKYEEKKAVTNSIYEILKHADADSSSYKEDYVNETSFLTVNIKNCKSLSISPELKSLSSSSAECFVMLIDDNQFDVIKYIYWDGQNKIDSIVFNPETDLFKEK